MSRLILGFGVTDDLEMIEAGILIVEHPSNSLKLLISGNLYWNLTLLVRNVAVGSTYEQFFDDLTVAIGSC